MNRKHAMRVVHLAAAGLMGVAIYIAVITFTVNDASTWSSFNNTDCTNPVSGAFCFLAGAVSILFKIVTIGLPLAILISGIYLKLAKFSLIASILIPIFANITALFAIVFIGLHFEDISLAILAALIPFTYILVGVHSIRGRTLQPQTK